MYFSKILFKIQKFSFIEMQNDSHFVSASMC